MPIFKELSDDRKWEIVSNHISDDWHDDLIQVFEDELQESGFNQSTISYSGFWSQGDGASFTCDDIDIQLFISKHLPEMDFKSNQLIQYKENMDNGLDSLTQLGFSEEEAGVITPVLHKVFKEGYSIYYGRVMRSNTRYLHERSTTLSIDIENYDIVHDIEERDLDNNQFMQEDEFELESFYEYLEEWMGNWIVSKNQEMYQRLYKERNQIEAAEYARLESSTAEF